VCNGKKYYQGNEPIAYNRRLCGSLRSSKSRKAGLHISPGRYTEILKEARIFINTKKFPALKLLAFKKGHKKQILFFFGGENFFISYLLKPLINIFFSKSPLISNFHGGDFTFPCHFIKSRFSYF